MNEQPDFTTAAKPGMVISTEVGRLIPGDYTISAFSRDTHAWAYLTSIIILLTAAANLIKTRKHRK